MTRSELISQLTEMVHVIVGDVLVKEDEVTIGHLEEIQNDFERYLDDTVIAIKESFFDEEDEDEEDEDDDEDDEETEKDKE